MKPVQREQHKESEITCHNVGEKCFQLIYKNNKGLEAT